jgi:hypothetical protein
MMMIINNNNNNNSIFTIPGNKDIPTGARFDLLTDYAAA